MPLQTCKNAGAQGVASADWALSGNRAEEYRQGSTHLGPCNSDRSAVFPKAKGNECRADVPQVGSAPFAKDLLYALPKNTPKYRFAQALPRHRGAPHTSRLSPNTKALQSAHVLLCAILLYASPAPTS